MIVSLSDYVCKPLQLLGVVFAFVALLCLGVGVLVFLLTQSIAAGAGAGVFFGFTTLGLVRRFIYGTSNQ